MTLTNAGGHLPIQQGPEENEKVEEKWILSLYLSWNIHLLLLSDIRAPGSCTLGHRLGLTTSGPRFSGLQTWTEFHQYLSWVLQLADSRLWDFLASIIVWANSYNKSLIYVHIYPIGSISLESPNTDCICIKFASLQNGGMWQTIIIVYFLIFSVKKRLLMAKNYNKYM